MVVMANSHSLRVAVLGLRGIPDVMGGVERHCQELYPRLVTRGIAVTLLARKGYVPDAEYEFAGVCILPLWTPRRKSLEAIVHTFLGLCFVARHRSQFDLIHVHAIGPALLTPIARLLGLRVVMTHHGPDYDRQKWGRLAKTVLRLGEYWGCRWSHRIIGVSQHITQTIHAKFRAPSVYIPNGVPLPERVPAGAAIAKWGLQPGKYLLAVARLVPEKGLHDLIEAFQGIDLSWQLVIAGSADHEDSYSRELHALAARDSRVVMTGFVKGMELGELYSNAGLFVLPSYHEGLPIALLEGLSYGLPVVASSIPANRELAKPDELFPAGDIDGLRKLLFERMSSEPRAGRSAEVARDFNWDRIADATADLYRQVCS